MTWNQFFGSHLRPPLTKSLYGSTGALPPWPILHDKTHTRNLRFTIRLLQLHKSKLLSLSIEPSTGLTLPKFRRSARDDITHSYHLLWISGVPRNFVRGGWGVGGFNKFSWGQRTERMGIWEWCTLVRGSGGSCNLVEEIAFHIVKFS